MSVSSPIEETRALRTPAVQVDSDWRTIVRAIVVLFKLRIVALLLLAATGGAFLGAGGWPNAASLSLLLITGGMAAAGASALNEYLERDSDGAMARTRHRPLVKGVIRRPDWVLAVGGGLVLLPVLAVLPFNPALAFFLLLGAIIYVGVYTIWLKPRTVLNIVIGGAAGSAAVLSGGAAVGAWREPAVWVLALLLFLWTPTHFWSLAILYRKDYARAGLPMLPTQTTLRQAARWVLVHTAATSYAALMLAAVPGIDWIYLLPVAMATIAWLHRNAALLRSPTPRQARSLFVCSNLYLMIVLLLACVDLTLPVP